MPPPGRFNFSRAVHEWSFVQLPLIELGAIRKDVTSRGLEDFGHMFASGAWETLDREGLVEPVAYARHGLWHHNQPECLEDGDLAIREEVGHRPWAELREEAESVHGDKANLQVLYHHWQLLWLGQLERQLTPAVPWGNLSDGLDTFLEMRAQLASPPEVSPVNALREMSSQWRATELLLVRVQNVFYPFERGGPRESNWTGSFVVGLTEDAIEWSMDQLNTLDYAALAEDCEVTPAELAATYEDLVRRGLWIDPAGDLIDLMDQIRRSHRERLKGAARLALDYYDAARVIRFWHERITEEWLPDVDEYRGINGTEYKQRRFGTVHVRGDRSVLPVLLEDYGLYPWRVQLIAEGDSEITALRFIVEQYHGLSFASLGVAVTDMGGADIPSNAERLLGTMRGYVNYFLLVFDNEGKAREMINTLVRAQTIEGVRDSQRAAIISEAAKAAKQIEDADARRAALEAARERASGNIADPGVAPEFVLWKENFEADNFDLAEMRIVVNQTATRQGLIGFEMTEDEIEQAIGEETEGKAVASVFLETAAAKDAGFRLSKPEFAELLAQLAINNPEREGRRRPLLDLAGHLIQLTWADRRLAGRLRE
jgi:hypothetical protein